MAYGRETILGSMGVSNPLNMCEMGEYVRVPFRRPGFPDVLALVPSPTSLRAVLSRLRSGAPESSPTVLRGRVGRKDFLPLDPKTISLPNCQGRTQRQVHAVQWAWRDSHLGMILPPREHLAMTEDLFGYHKVRRGMLLAFSESKEVKMAALDCLKQGRCHPTPEPQQKKAEHRICPMVKPRPSFIDWRSTRM